MKIRSASLVAAVCAVAVACGTVASPIGAPLTAPQLKYRLIDRFGPPAYCDRDSYPLGRAEQPIADAMYDEIRAQTEVFEAITEHEHLPLGGLDEPQKLALYRGYKLLSALALTPTPDGYSFSYTATRDYMKRTGTIRSDGLITVTSEAQGGRPECPICLAASTLIATPSGDVLVTKLEPGMLVWSVDATGRRVAEPVLRTGSTAVPRTHLMVELSLADGRELLASPGHRLADGRALGSLRVGDEVDGSRVSVWQLVPYAGARTYDLLPAGVTGFYWAGGILLASTLSGTV